MTQAVAQVTVLMLASVFLLCVWAEVLVGSSAKMAAQTMRGRESRCKKGGKNGLEGKKEADPHLILEVYIRQQ